MSRRFFVQGPLQPGFRDLTGPEAHHLARVLRMSAGQSVILFNGQDLQAEARVVRLGPDVVSLEVGLPTVVTTEAPVQLTLGVAVPKGDRFSWLVEKATELGVRRLVPLVTERSVVDPGAGKIEKMRRTIIEASKQCGRSQLMELTDPQPWPEFVSRQMTGTNTWIADPTGAPLDPSRFPESGNLVAAVGPEGGFTDREIELAREQGAVCRSLGPRILRIETAALAVASLLTACRSI